MKADIPHVFQILVEDRNTYLVNSIKELMEKNPDKKIVIFLGKGHVVEIKRRLMLE